MLVQVISVYFMLGLVRQGYFTLGHVS